ncbi:uncharacterized protein LAJ45_03741 [Morchella importuna]|uniref:uncharacterized protein n=1 Tax=Morchella importuna TaxID=1174673 RepID=UPI001E8E53CE|nr:uncharacterized protein LAJ45_03741 [Morchella importuna]KAH8152314.1 hypothetical protein LAJ45_03741 [Morchella importuna]
MRVYAANTQSIPRKAWATASSWLGPDMPGLGDFLLSTEDSTGQPIMSLSSSRYNGSCARVWGDFICTAAA